MTARSRPRALMAPLNVATTSAPEAVRITSATAPAPMPTAPGWLLRQRRETTVAIPATMATTRSQAGCCSHVSLAPMHDEVMSATQWAHAGTALAIWMLLPLAIGAWRITRREIAA
jgi:hypothetical protein